MNNSTNNFKYSDNKEKIAQFVKQQIEKEEIDEKKVSSKEYLDWVLNTVITVPHHIIDDDMYLYDATVSLKEKENMSKLSRLQKYISKLAEIQGVTEIEYNEVFPRYGYCFYYNLYYLEIDTVVGQGAITSIRLCKEKPNVYVLLSEQTDELVQYLIVNQDLGMSSGKIAAQVGHACTMCAVKEFEKSAFKHWYNGNQKKIVLRAHQKEMEKLLNKGYYEVRDNGLTEVAPNSLTVISLGVSVKKDVKQIVNRFQLL